MSGAGAGGWGLEAVAGADSRTDTTSSNHILLTINLNSYPKPEMQHDALEHDFGP